MYNQKEQPPQTFVVLKMLQPLSSYTKVFHNYFDLLFKKQNKGIINSKVFLQCPLRMVALQW